MDATTLLKRRQQVQTIAKRVLRDLGPTIVSTDTEQSIADRAVGMLQDQGVSETWYYDCPALVLLGSRSSLSSSGKVYQPANELVGATNLVTVDISPSLDGVWGDCARSYCVEDGRAVDEPSLPELRRGKRFVLQLHQILPSIADSNTTFGELYDQMLAVIVDGGYETLDFLGNFGHTLPGRLDERIYIQTGDPTRLKEVACFTFEPHIRQIGGTWGFKHENIYRVDDDGRIVEL
ncbi:M24 family metallopeptidase [Blastopirellula sp. JC732]|uniref:M24 family metallopeptidase n=1 Tax=Blastopirellula sediminis TaxID=2894196 RepID=A0A9X1SMW1_9BACT|nr:M24 family metallopeptidase [Blastopirellula sediminis]MCC9604602.1 M24 family metallopeptidase [Blastopirellula sediminis]MCC9632099.1 M24 family metallopeptidase [Blastopirellula sediminis]